MQEPTRYPDGYDWVKVRATRRFNVSRRDWNADTNMPFEDGEEGIVARDGRGMQYYIDEGFFEVVDDDPFNTEPEEPESGPAGEDETQEVGTCEVEKADGEICGRDLPCMYHSDNSDEDGDD